MSGLGWATRRAAERAHARARSLASDQIDMDLDPVDGRWLKEHLAACSECRSLAQEYQSLHDELHGLARPEPPRDLWARTSAALDEVDRARAAAAGQSVLSALADRFGSGGFSGRRLTSPKLMAGAALALAVAIVGMSAFARGPFAQTASRAPSTPGIAAGSPAASASPAALAVVAVVGGNSYWVTPVGGVYEIKGGSADCAGTRASCTVTNDNGQVLGSVASRSDVRVVISPNGSRAAVWNADKVVVMPLSSKASTVSIDLLTPRPSGAVPTAVATATATPAPTPVESAIPTEQPSPAATSTPTEAPSAAVASPTPAPTPAPTPTPTPTATPAANQPLAILGGYRVVGRDPEFSADGQWVAFSARPSGDKAGSDVFVWHSGWDAARSITSAHADLFAGWLGPRILISQFESTGSSTVATSYVYNPADDSERRIYRPMLMPVVDPTSHYVVYWSGTVRFDASTGLWEPGQGDLYFDKWSNVLNEKPAVTPAPTPQPNQAAMSAGATPAMTESPAAELTPSPAASLLAASPTAPPSLPQLVVVSRPGRVATWVVRWDGSGRYVSIWVGEAGDDGRVTLLDVLPGRDLLNLNGPLLSTAARSNIAFDGSQFVYSSPSKGGDGKTYLFALPATPPDAPTPTPVPTPTPTPTPTSQPTDTPVPTSAS